MIPSFLRSALKFGCILLCCGATGAPAEYREFTDVQGRKVTAEPVSHNGSGLLEMKKEGGPLFQLEISRLSPEDQTFIQKWIDKTPAKLDYRFEVKAAADKVAGNRKNYGYKKVKNEMWAYKVEIKNVARNTVGAGGLKVEYRVFVKNEAQGSFASDDMDGYHPGVITLTEPMRYNETLSFTTNEVPLDSVNYDYSTSRYSDALRGLMLRITDARGVVVHEYVSPITTLKGKSWGSIPKSAEIRTPQAR